jgi:hypothetical protein
MNAVTPGLGHNSSNADEADLPAALDPALLRDQLGLDHAALIAKRDDHVAEVTRFFDKLPNGPQTDEDQGRAGDMVKEIKQTAKLAEEAHKAAKAPYLSCGRVVDAFLKQETLDALVALAGKVERIMGVYARAKADRERAEAQAEAARQAAEAQRLAEIAAAETNPVKAEIVMDRAVELADRAEAATTVAAGPVADLSRVRGSFGSNSSYREKWVHRVDDLMALVKAVAAGEQPLHYLMANDSAIAAAVRAKGGVRSIPGLTIYDDGKAQVR